MRAVHLPVEHKTSLESYDEEEYYKETKNKYEDEDEYKDACENKSICEIILRGANKNSDILSTLVWNLRTKYVINFYIK